MRVRLPPRAPMTQPESRLQRRIRKALQQEYPNSYWYKVHGGRYTPAGIPDLMGCVLGLMFSLEVKRPGHEASLVQLKRMRDLRRAGAIVATVTSPDEAIAAVRGWRPFPTQRRFGRIATGHPLKARWNSMIQRCYGNVAEHRCGWQDQGIQVYGPWLIRHYRAGFWEYATYIMNHLGPCPSDRHELDRIDNQGHYQPGNLQWISTLDHNRKDRKLTYTQALLIRAHRREGASLAELSTLFGVSKAQVSLIAAGKRWKDF